MIIVNYDRIRKIVCNVFMYLNDWTFEHMQFSIFFDDNFSLAAYTCMPYQEIGHLLYLYNLKCNPFKFLNSSYV